MMKRVRQSDPQRQQQWQATVNRWRASGQSVRAFCREEGLRETAFFYWRRELARRQAKTKQSEVTASPPQPSMPGGARFRRSGGCLVPELPHFLPVHLRDGRCEERPAALEIVLSGGRKVRVPQGVDRQTLAEVVAVLESLPC